MVIGLGIVVISEAPLGKELFVIGGLACFLLWLKLFYFLRLFRPTASFIRMIIEMIKDIRVFLLIFFVGVFAFANFYYILDLGNVTKVVTIGKASYMETIIYTYMQSLGELGYDGFNDSDLAGLYWGIFFISTVFLCITLLNLLIAIMGDTFGRVLEV